MSAMKDPARSPHGSGNKPTTRLVIVFCVLGCTAILVGAGMLAGALGLLGTGVLVLAGIPVAGFTRNQWRATSRALQVARSVDEIELIKRTDAEAFAHPIVAWRRRTDQSYTARRPSRPAPPAAWTGASWRAVQPPPERRTGTEVERPRTSPRNFWESLTAAEQRELVGVARDVSFGADEVLWRRGEPADYVMVIRSGWTKICDERSVPERIIAFRGPGDLIGERAALRPRSRSATVVAVEAVRALRITTWQFSVFTHAHPHVLNVLEEQVYDRLSEVAARSNVWRDQEAVWTGQTCSILLTDIASFSSRKRNERDRRLIRQVTYGLLRQAFDRAGLAWSSCHREDRGDGALLVIPPSIPTGLIVDPLLGYLADGLRKHNLEAQDATRIQLRVALHVGPVISDPEGVTGDAIILARRLLDAPILKRQLDKTAADVGFITSGFVYETYVRYGLAGFDPADYQCVQFQAKEARIKAWMRFANPGSRERTA